MKKYRILDMSSSSEIDDLIDNFLDESKGKITYEEVKEKLEEKGFTVVSEGKYNARLVHYRRHHKSKKNTDNNKSV